MIAALRSARAGRAPTRRLGVVPALALVCSNAMAQAADASAVLTELARTLADARANPANAARARCPAKVNALAGLSVGQVLIELGQPAQGAAGNTLNYSAGGAPGAGARGGGALEVTFNFDAKGTVTAVECRAAK